MSKEQEQLLQEWTRRMRMHIFFPQPILVAIENIIADNARLRATLQSIADQTRCNCWMSEPENTCQRHSSGCMYYIREEALESLEAEKEKVDECVLDEYGN